MHTLEWMNFFWVLMYIWLSKCTVFAISPFTHSFLGLCWHGQLYYAKSADIQDNNLWTIYDENLYILDEGMLDLKVHLGNVDLENTELNTCSNITYEQVIDNGNIILPMVTETYYLTFQKCVILLYRYICEMTTITLDGSDSQEVVFGWMFD